MHLKEFTRPELFIWENFEIVKIFNFGNSPSEKSISLKLLKLAKQAGAELCQAQVKLVVIVDAWS